MDNLITTLPVPASFQGGLTMSKGTPSMGKRQKSTHIRCRRCGRHSYHKQKGQCAHCGYGVTSKIRKFRWSKRNRSMWQKK